MDDAANTVQLKYVAKVVTPEYITGTFSMLGVAKLILWMDAVKEEFEMDAEVEAILEGFRGAYVGELNGEQHGEAGADLEGTV